MVCTRGHDDDRRATLGKLLVTIDSDPPRCEHLYDVVALGVRMMSGLIGCLLVAFAVSGCGGTSTMTPPSEAVQRNVAARFAAAVFRGDAAGARALLVRADEAALVFLVERAAARWTTRHAAIQLAARRTGNGWTFSYAGRRTQRDGRFETERGHLVVFVAPSAAGAGIRFFAFKHVRTRFSTHQDAQLLPSKR
jgi:hypothetical protein